MAKIAALAFGRLNPPSRAHEQVLVRTISEQQGDKMLFLSHSQDSKSNPLSYEQKVYYCTKAFSHMVTVVESEAKTMYQVLENLYNEGYTDIIYVCGSDRVAEAERFKQYNGKPTKAGTILFDFNSIEIVKAGDDRINEDDVPLELVSASMMRQFVVDDDLESFMANCPSKLSQQDREKMFEDVKVGLKLLESLDENVLDEDSLDDIINDTKSYYYGEESYNVDTDKCVDFLKYIESNKDELAQEPKNAIKRQLASQFDLALSRGLLLGRDFDVSVKVLKGSGYTNAVTSIKNLINRIYKPVFNIVVSPSGLRVYLLHLKFINKVSHSSKALSMDNWRGTVLGSNISDGALVTSDNFKQLWEECIDEDFTSLLNSIVNNTHEIKAKNSKIEVTEQLLQLVKSNIEYSDAHDISNEIRDILNESLYNNITQEDVDSFNESDVNTRGNNIEKLILGSVNNQHDFADYMYDDSTAVDIKTHLKGSSSNPKLFNLDKYVNFLTIHKGRCSFYLYIVEIGDTLDTVETYCYNIYATDLVKGLNVVNTNAGRNSLGVVQGKIKHFNNSTVDVELAYNKIKQMLEKYS